MVTLSPFKALRPPDHLAAQVAAPPYDVLSREEATTLIQRFPQSILRITRADGSLDRSIPWDDDSVYRLAADQFREFINHDILREDPHNAFYLYRQTTSTHTQTGVVALASVDDYRLSLIKPHEKTRENKVLDRTRLMSTCAASLEPVFLTYRETPDLNRLIENFTGACPPAVDFTCPLATRHEVWVVADSNAVNALQRAFADVSSLYIADGHHRAASTFQLAQNFGARNPKAPPVGLLSVLFPAQQLCILGYHRLVTDIRPFTAAMLYDRLARDFHMEPLGPDQCFVPESPGTFGLVLGGEWTRMTLKHPPLSHPSITEGLDASLLQEHVFHPLLQIENPRTDPRLDFAGGSSAPQVLNEASRKNPLAAGFTLCPVTMMTLLAVADAGGLMPPKSTWFEPKIKSGLFLHRLEA